MTSTSNRNHDDNGGLHANLRAHPDIFVLRDGDTTSEDALESEKNETRLRSQSVFESTSSIRRTSGHERSSVLLSQSYGGDSNSSLLFRQGLLPPAAQFHRNHSATIPGMSSITYSGYLYKRSNFPHRNVDEIVTNHYQEEEHHYPQHQLPLHVEDQIVFPELPVMPGVGLAKDRSGFKANFPVTPSPANIQSNKAQTGESDTQQRRFSESRKTEGKNPLQIGLEIGAALFGIHLNPTKNPDDPSQHRYDNHSPSTVPGSSSLPIPDNMPGIPRSARRPIPNNNTPSSHHIDRNQSSFLEASHRRHSAPILLSESPLPSSSKFSSSKNSPGNSWIPQDFIDPEDGHLWRAKYCVLEDGVLYFYKNANDGNSIEAVAERKRQSMGAARVEDNDTTIVTTSAPIQNEDEFNNDRNTTYSTSYDDSIGLFHYRRSLSANDNAGLEAKQEINLGHRMQQTSTQAVTNFRRKTSAKELSKSPMVRSGRHLVDASGLTSADAIEFHIWEKRVFMDCVGGVRTAEQQYGENSFELLAMDDEETDENAIDTLVLKGQNPTEMKEWIFQFHRTLASFMRNFIDVVGSTSMLSTSGAMVDHSNNALLSPSLSSRQLSSSSMAGTESIPQSSSEKHLHRLMSTSPSLPITLSHGHGRTTLKRRMDVRRTPSDSVSLSSTPDTGDMDFLHHTFPFQEPSPSTARMSPELTMPPVRHLIPPPIQSYIPPLERGFYIESSPLSRGPPVSTDSNRKNLKDPQHHKPSSESESSRPKPSTGAKYIPPQLRNKKKYIPPHLRRKQNQQAKSTSGNESNDKPRSSTTQSATDDKMKSGFLHTQTTPLISVERSRFTPITPPTDHYSVDTPTAETSKTVDHLDIVSPSTSGFILGGCADPKLVEGSILDPIFIPKKASRLKKSAAEAYGSFGGNFSEESKDNKSSLCWEIGAISECGVRESNEDSYILTNDLLSAFDSGSYGTSPQSFWKKEGTDHNIGLFGIFDGHCGNQGARFAVEQLGRFVHDELNDAHDDDQDFPFCPSNMESILHKAIVKMDERFCNLCQEEGREWESGATALVAMLANENLVIASLGDCRGFICRFVDDADSYKMDEQWEQLDAVMDNHNEDLQQCFWREVTTVHSPSVEQEKARIEKANGWITTETEIPIGQFRRMDFHDEDVIGILKRCMHHPSSNGGTSFTDSERSTKECKAAPQRIIHISRVCGELAVSRALGDRDFKADFNSASKEHETNQADLKVGSTSEDSFMWESTLFLPYPDNHSRMFQGDLVTNTPDFHRVKLGKEGVSDEFLLLACDGLWDVMDADDAVRVVRDLLFRKKVTAKKAAARLAELAIHLGSSDNITVILIRLFSRNANIE